MPGFDMPGASASFEARGGWVTKALAAEFGLTLAQAAGIVGNLGFESGGFKELREIGQPDGRGGYGWGQWTADRHVTFLAFATKKGLDWRSDEANYGYLVTELAGPYRNTITAVKRAATVDAAVFSVGQTYERPGGTTPGHLPGYTGRLAWGNRALAGAQGMQATPAAPHDDVVTGPTLNDEGKVGVATQPHAAPKPAPESDDDAVAEALTRTANPSVFGNNC